MSKLSIDPIYFRYQQQFVETKVKNNIIKKKLIVDEFKAAPVKQKEKEEISEILSNPRKAKWNYVASYEETGRDRQAEYTPAELALKKLDVL